MSSISLAVSLGAGVPLLGRVYDPNKPVSVPTNGQFHGGSEFMGLFLLIYMGTLSILMWASFVPSIAVLKFPFWVMKTIFACLLLAALVACSLVMVYMIEPQKTFTESVVGGTGDPLLAAAGCFYFVSFAYMALLAGSILFRMSGTVKTMRENVIERISHNKVPAFLALCLTLWYCFNYPLGFLMQAASLSLSSCARHQVPTTHPFLSDSAGAGETWPGRYFRATSPYSLVNWKWSDNFIYKLYPDVLGYYLFISVVVAVSTVCHRYPRIRLLLHRRVWVC